MKHYSGTKIFVNIFKRRGKMFPCVVKWRRIHMIWSQIPVLVNSIMSDLNTFGIFSGFTVKAFICFKISSLLTMCACGVNLERYKRKKSAGGLLLTDTLPKGSTFLCPSRNILCNVRIPSFHPSLPSFRSFWKLCSSLLFSFKNIPWKQFQIILMVLHHWARQNPRRKPQVLLQLNFFIFFF